MPAGVQNPELVYNVLYDMWNWYDGDTSVRDDAETLYWWYAVTSTELQLKDANFDVMYDSGTVPGDLQAGAGCTGCVFKK